MSLWISVDTLSFLIQPNILPQFPKATVDLLLISLSTRIVEQADFRTDLVCEGKSARVSAVERNIPILCEVETPSAMYVYMA